MPGGYTTEYAKSGRSTCKGCQKLIAQGELRIGKMVQSPHFDGEVPLWHHRACLFKREAISSAALLAGLDNLRPEDVKSLKAQCGGGGAAGGAAVAVLPSSVAGDRFTVEYAKSGRSSCKHCAQKIDDGELRVGRMVQSQQFDGMVPNWHHLDCVFKSQVIYSVALVDNLDSLRPEDQKELKALIAKHSPATAAGAGAAAATDADGDVAMKAEGKAKKGKKKKRGDDSDAEDEPPAKKAATEDYSKLTVAALQTKCKELGLKSSGKKADLVARLEEAAAADGGAADGDAAAGAAAAAAPAAPVDPVKAAHEAALEAESKVRWKIKDSVADLSTSEIKALLQANNQPDKGGRDKLVDLLVYGLMYGALPACPECGNQSLSFKDGEYVCGGMASEWGRCLYKAAEVKHAEWDLSESDNDYLSSFKFKFMKKPVEAYAFFAAESRAAAEQHKAFNAAADEVVKARQQQLLKQSVLDELLDGFDICVVGAKHADGQGGTKTLKEIKALVEAHGGALVSDVDDADMIIAAAEGEAASSNKKLKQAAADKKPVLLASFLFDSIAKAELQDPQSYSALSATADQQGDNWTGLKDKVQTGRQKSGAKLSGASGAAAAAGGKSVGKSSGGKVTVKVKGRAAVDDDSGLSDSAHVLEERDDVWAVTLNITDISTGVNSFYILQLIEGDARADYTVFRKWGRVGTTIGNHKVSAHGSSKDGAKQEFKEVYLDKTGNRWDERKNFVKKPGKFFPIDVDYSGGDDPLDAAADADTGVSTSKLDPRIQDLMRIFFDVQAIKKTLLSMEIDLTKMPLGKLSRKHIESGYGVLTEIQEAIKAEPVSEGRLLALSNKFYTIIPHTINSHESAPILRTEDDIKKKLEMIDSLLEIEIATKMLKEGAEGGAANAAAAAQSLSMDPIDVHYRQLKTDMKVLEHSSGEFSLIKTYITNTHAPTHTNYTLDLLEAFAVDRENEGSRYQAFEKDPNRMLLWHGSRLTNFVGILSQGLRIAPPEAPVTGYMFGKGVYFADMVSKSANYCFTSTANNVGFLLLCEVALGEMNLLKNAQYMDKAPGSCLSTKGLGTTGPDPKGTVTLDNGCVVPAGRPVKTDANSSLLYNEFIVYDVG